MSLSRRQFVYVASLSVVTTAAGPSLFAAPAASKTITDAGAEALGSFSLRDFEGLIGDRFSISLNGRSLGQLVLIAATATASPTATSPVKSSQISHVAGPVATPVPSRPLIGFWLRFQGSGGALPQDTYLMEDSVLGAFPLFLVPEGPGGSKHTTYLAFFTRFAAPA